MLLKFIIVILIIYLSFNYFKVSESFVPYKIYNEWKTGSL